MHALTPVQSGLRAGSILRTALAIAATLYVVPACAQDAEQLLKGMSDYVGGQKNISFTYDSSIEVVTPELEKIQFTSTGQVVLTRPDKVRVTRTGGYADVELVFDGKVATLYGKNLNAYAQFGAPGSTAQLVDKLRENAGADLPGADLLSPESFALLTSDVIEAKHIGRGVIEGVECEHLAFRNGDSDWQIWIEPGSHPIPHKYVITSKAITGAPQYTVVIRNWRTDAPSESAFAFKPTADAKKVDLAALADIDEVPPGVQPGARK
jgi:hypothetical protein